MKNVFYIKLPLTGEGEYLTTVRLTTGGICALANFDVDSAEDFKVCVTESLLILKRNGYQNAEIEYVIGEQLGCKIKGVNADELPQESIEDEISYALLNALLGKVEFTQNDGGRVETIAFEA
jgi:hypothetical protein